MAARVAAERLTRGEPPPADGAPVRPTARRRWSWTCGRRRRAPGGRRRPSRAPEPKLLRGCVGRARAPLGVLVVVPAATEPKSARPGERGEAPVHAGTGSARESAVVGFQIQLGRQPWL